MSVQKICPVCGLAGPGDTDVSPDPYIDGCRVCGKKIEIRDRRENPELVKAWTNDNRKRLNIGNFLAARVTVSDKEVEVRGRWKSIRMFFTPTGKSWQAAEWICAGGTIALKGLWDQNFPTFWLMNQCPFCKYGEEHPSGDLFVLPEIQKRLSSLKGWIDSNMVSDLYECQKEYDLLKFGRPKKTEEGEIKEGD